MQSKVWEKNKLGGLGRILGTVKESYGRREGENGRSASRAGSVKSGGGSDSHNMMDWKEIYTQKNGKSAPPSPDHG